MRKIVLSMLLAVFMSCGAFAAEVDGSEIHSPSVKVVTLTHDGGHVDVLRKDNGLIVFDRRGEDGYFDIWTMRKDGTDQKNLTSGKDVLPGKHTGDPEWHPSGKWIVFQAQKAEMPSRYDNKGVPGAGVLNDLWLMTGNGSKFWKLIDLPLDFKNWPGILHPHFSHDGNRLIWAQRIGRGKSPFGAWVIKLANFNFEDTRPFLSDIETLTPGQKGRSEAFYETHGFSPDGRKIIFSSDFERGLNIYVMDLDTGVVTNRTSSRDWDEHALFSPDGTRIAWMSSRGLRFRARPFLLETEWWMMDADGNNKNRLTYFHRKGHAHYRKTSEKQPLTIAADVAWEKDGKHLVGLVIHGDPGGGKRGTGEIVRITLNSQSQTTNAPEKKSGAERAWRVEKIADRGGRVDWFKGRKHNLIAYDAITDRASANTNLFVMRPDGREKKCVTCNTSIPKGFVGQPAWHPDGEHIVFQAENRHSDHRLLNHMAWGINNNLWLIKRDGTEAELIWESAKNHAALHPHFNGDGTRIVFAERVPTGKSWRRIKRLRLGAGGENHWDGWRIHLADFDIARSGRKMLSSHREFTPNGNGFYETHGFTDNGKIVYSFTPGGHPYVDDIYMCDSDGTHVRKLIDSPATWDEHGIFSPSGKAMAFISSRADENWRAPRSRAKSLRTELFLKKEGKISQLTHFNKRSGGEKRYLVSDYDWNRDGDRIVFQLAPLKDGRAASPELWMILFSETQ